MMANQRIVDVIADNLSNAATPGHKSERATPKNFKDFVVNNLSDGKPVGPLSMGSAVGGVAVDMSQGSTQQTDRSLDVAIEGEGFLAVRGPEGTRYTRNGSLMRDNQGYLATQSGLRVLGSDGQPIQIPGADVEIAPDGRISSEGRAVGQVGLFSLTNPTRATDGLFSGQATAAGGAGQIRQGALETSNVSEIDQMSLLMQTMRTFESSQRVLKAIDQTLQRAASEIGRI
jgi:flagellar basal-body rod protein FlgG